MFLALRAHVVHTGRRQEVFGVPPGQPARWARGGLSSKQCEEDRQSPFPTLNHQDYPRLSKTVPRLVITSIIHRFPSIGIVFNEDNIWKRKRISIRTTKCSERQPRNQANPTNPRDLRQRFAPMQPEMYGIPLCSGNAETKWEKSVSIRKNQ